VTTEKLEKAYASTKRVLGNVTKEDMTASTPCKSWDVRELVNHIVGTPFYFAAAVESGVGATDDPEPDFADADFTASFEEGTRLVTLAFHADGAMERIVKLPFGELPAEMVMNIAAVDSFVHGWDLARATGQSTDLDPALAEEFLGIARVSIPDAFRGDEPAPFGPPVDAPASATAADRLAAFLGRTP
jgi:uncharacterized protein (TIGR03086 family)